MVHTAHDLTPPRTTRSARPQVGVAHGEGAAVPPHDELRDAQLVRAMRRALARRGADALRIFRLEYPGPLACWPCFREATRALGGDLTCFAPEDDEGPQFEAYDSLYYRFERAEERVGRPDDYAEHEECPRDGLDVSFSASYAYGLVRLTFPESTLWVWNYSLCTEGGEACVAARDRSELRPFLRAIKRLHRDHLRSESRVTLIGGKHSSQSSLAPLTWDDVVLPPALRAELEQTVSEFFGARELYRRHRVPHRRGILLAGPPGNGKTSILRAIGGSAQVPLVVTVVDEGGSNLARAFSTAADLAPAILCLEDLDSLVDAGSSRTQFLNLLDGLKPLEGVLVIGTTNHPESIDPAITKRPSRFDRVFVIPEPGLAQREAYLAKELGADAPLGAVTHYAQETEGYSVAFLKELVLQARLAAVRRGEATLSRADLEAALRQTQEHLNLSGFANRGELGFAASVSARASATA